MKHLSRACNRSFVLFAIPLVLSLPCFAGSNAAEPTAPSAPPKPLHVYRSLIPLGSEIFAYSHHGEHETFYIMASTSNREFDGQGLYADGQRRVLKLANGNPVEHYPRELHFRVSVSERGGYAPIDPPMPVDSHYSTFGEFISSLKFEMRVFHALKARLVKPTRVTQIGMPVDVPSNERIYDVAFDLGEVPISDRLVMHVLTAEGDRLAKFNVDLY
ncbi:hypothetical protein Acid345_2879 [Candidatus Koribacter versatilis Ellin345]|uniref:DUF3108 domain-containing protein n=1 Tax=Koribacter versatilis (strain Ellin345) TaxID=204669 RepID=Q1IMM0_KORVE|nr:hypothetical protein [Candidatus Koribacter versatilis]ABF41880.1 hypothetical protein Acid345_2879 [Candidatus Koribacter versatilis Ellin345]